jgi:uncharacterized protein (DUF1501 family)
MHQSLAPVNTLFNSGRVAVVLNTGQLERPLTRQEFQSGVLAPSNLFSHSDQTLQAQTATSNSTIGGWGGRLLDVFGVNDTLGAVSVSSPAAFLQSGGGAPNVIPPGASLNLSGLNIYPPAAATARRNAVNAMLALDGGHPLRTAANGAFADGLQLADTLNNSGTVSNLTTVFPGTGLGNQMREVVKLIRLRSQIGPGRQVFFCSMGGFDTHTRRMAITLGAPRELANALSAFYNATVEAGVSSQVTAFTQSEFGRTIQPNGYGTTTLGRSSVHRRWRCARRHLRPDAGICARRSGRLRQSRRLDPEDLHVTVRRDARQVVRRDARRTRGGVPEPVAVPDERRRVHALTASPRAGAGYLVAQSQCVAAWAMRSGTSSASR